MIHLLSSTGSSRPGSRARARSSVASFFDAHEALDRPSIDSAKLEGAKVEYLRCWKECVTRNELEKAWALMPLMAELRRIAELYISRDKISNN